MPCGVSNSGTQVEMSAWTAWRMPRDVRLHSETSLAVDNFDNLPIRQASVVAMLAEKHSKAILRLLLVDSSGEFASICELQFNGVVDIVIDAVGMPLLGKVTGHNSAPANDVEKRPRHSLAMWKGPLTRFSIDTECARFEIVAEQHAFATVGRVAIVGN